MSARTAARLAAALLVASTGACSWFTDFKAQPKIDPWESAADTIPPRGNPQYSVPVYGSVAPGYAFGRAPAIATIDSMSGLRNPYPADARSLANGKKYYQINCLPCHGPAGRGDGPATRYGMVPIPLVSAVTQGRTDGYIFGMIRNGRGLMPTYNRIEEPDRWDVVNYVRTLQGVGGAVADTTLAARPGETGTKLPSATQSGPTRPSPYYHRIAGQAGAAEGATPVAPRPVAPRPAADTSKKGATP